MSTAGQSIPMDVGRFVDHHRSSFVAGWLATSKDAQEGYLRRRRFQHCMLVALLVSCSVNLFQGMTEARFRSVASLSDDKGTLLPLAVIKRPINTLPEVRRWVTEATTEAFTLDFSLLDKQFAASKPNFTDAGWRGYQKALADEKILQKIQDGKYQIFTVPTGVAVMTSTPVLHATSWTFQVPLVTTFVAGATQTSRQSVVEVTIVRQPPDILPRGLGIDSFKVE